jgi:hypothetical protein
MDRESFIRYLENTVSEKIQLLQNEIEQLRLDISVDSKSTAGDKHETSRAMTQLEMEKLGNQFLEYQKQLKWIKQLGSIAHNSSDTVGIGSLIQLTNGWYFLGLGIGKIIFENKTVFCISLRSPLGKQLFNKKIGQEINLPNLNLTIEFVN